LRERTTFRDYSGKQGWSIARKSIAIAMVRGESARIGRQIILDVVHVKAEFTISTEKHYYAFGALCYLIFRNDLVHFLG
jgi:hypothetical protein